MRAPQLRGARRHQKKIRNKSQTKGDNTLQRRSDNINDALSPAATVTPACRLLQPPRDAPPPALFLLFFLNCPRKKARPVQNRTVADTQRKRKRAVGGSRRAPACSRVFLGRPLLFIGGCTFSLAFVSAVPGRPGWLRRTRSSNLSA